MIRFLPRLHGSAFEPVAPQLDALRERAGSTVWPFGSLDAASGPTVKWNPANEAPDSFA
jgi:hypothetical protein